MKAIGSEPTLPGPLLGPRKRAALPPFRRLVRSLFFATILTVVLCIFYTPSLSFAPSTSIFPPFDFPPVIPEYVLKHRKHLSERCKAIRTPAGPPPGYRPESRLPYTLDVPVADPGSESKKKGKGSERYVPGTPPTLLRNGKIWTGGLNGTVVVYGDVLLDKGLVIAVGRISETFIEDFGKKGGKEKLVVVDLKGKWVTPGLVDLHSHIGVMSSPQLSGNMDGNSHKAPILPWLRSIDGLNTHDESYRIVVAGGVTTAQILPGSANNIGGQAFLIKLRPTDERSTSSKVLEPPEMLHYPNANSSDYIHWRHMKHACGENADRTYSQTRMDAAWNFRHAYNEAKKIKEAQDQFCGHVDAGRWEVIESESDSGPDSTGHKKKKKHKKLPPFPEDLQWESLVDVLRGRVKLSIHCYEAVDLDAIVRLSNEFQFPVASFHHATETYLVPDLLKKTWGGAPTIALFAINARKKREAYRGSEFAPRILADNGIPVVMKSDHPVLNSRHLLFEAQQAHYYGLSSALALSSITTVPARAAGLGHRIGMIAKGYDADIAVWDSHPLTLGATPVQVYIDGIAQLEDTHVLSKPESLQHVPSRPDWDCEIGQTVKWEGLPPLEGRKEETRNWRTIRFKGVQEAWVRDGEGNIVDVLNKAEHDNSEKVVVLRDGKVECVGATQDDCAVDDIEEDVKVVDLKGGSLAPALTTFGSPVGLVEIQLEPSANDGQVLDPLTNGNLPGILGNETIVRAVDGLQFETRHALLAYRSGVGTAVTAPSGSGFLLGISTAFDTGASNALEKGAVIQEDVAIHVAIRPALRVSVSTQVATLRRLVFEDPGEAWARVRKGDMTLAIHVDSADIMASLIRMKLRYEETSATKLRMTFVGAAEAHLVAGKIAKAGVSIVVTEPRPYPTTWDKRRFLPGPPLSADTLVTRLLANGVNVAIGVVNEADARNARFEMAWAMLNSNGEISRSQAIELVTVNLEQALGFVGQREAIVAYQGGSVFDMESKVVGVVSGSGGEVMVDCSE
ncbi:hypothetical protein AMATHDRAFT_65765 [Amanita thiersii Skay4041]|uniref:Amidohydrolase-related domain-containing protein n=1 Tax=Amanita thiersii Skay4041 TaxID=703135 RepID=A0A2A9NE66_9AGAR|nr:hypothetical protein AMATHDRAFT_65765 [Amanita thiersii Skay4041]